VGGYEDDAALACEYIATRVRQKAGPRWLQGAVREHRAPAPTAPAVRLFAEQRLLGVKACVAQGLVAWARGEREVDVLFSIPTARAVLGRQARGRRCVSLLAEGVNTAPHEDGLAFAIHDLCHLEKFVAPEHFHGQRGFFAHVDRVIDGQAWRAFEEGFDEAWATDRDYVVSDMNGSAIFLFSALKMKLKMAVRRKLAREEGRSAPTGGALSPGEVEAFAAAMETLLDLFEFRGAVRDAAAAVSTKHDAPGAARALLAYFEAA
jgi:hypothetical protein